MTCRRCLQFRLMACCYAGSNNGASFDSSRIEAGGMSTMTWITPEDPRVLTFVGYCCFYLHGAQPDLKAICLLLYTCRALRRGMPTKILLFGANYSCMARQHDANTEACLRVPTSGRSRYYPCRRGPCTGRRHAIQRDSRVHYDWNQKAMRSSILVPVKVEEASQCAR